MSEKVVIGSAELWLGDCLEILPTLPKVDAVITDPPYGIGFKYESHKDDADTYPDFLTARIFATRQLCNPGAFQAWFQAMKNVARFHEWFPIGWRIYAAAKNFVQIRPCAMQYGYDPVVVWWEPGEQYKSGRGRDFFVADTASVISNPANLEKGHPAPRPLDQMKELVGNFANPAGAVLDPFMGSGTTGVACMNLGRKFIGIEIERKYFDIACRRIEDAQRQAPLIPHEPVHKHVQEGMFA
jgi:DNA modification methylase